MGDSEQALEYFAGYYQANPQNIRDLAAEKGPSSFDVKLNNVTTRGLPASLRQGPPIRLQHESRSRCVCGRMGDHQHQHRSHGPRRSTWSTAPPGPTLSAPFPTIIAASRSCAPMSPAAAVSQSRSAMLNTYFAGYTFSTPPASAPFGECRPQCVPRTQLRPVGLLD